MDDIEWHRFVHRGRRTVAASSGSTSRERAAILRTSRFAVSAEPTGPWSRPRCWSCSVGSLPGRSALARKERAGGLYSAEPLADSDGVERLLPAGHEHVVAAGLRVGGRRGRGRALERPPDRRGRGRPDLHQEEAKDCSPAGALLRQGDPGRDRAAKEGGSRRAPGETGRTRGDSGSARGIRRRCPGRPGLSRPPSARALLAKVEDQRRHCVGRSAASPSRGSRSDRLHAIRGQFPGYSRRVQHRCSAGPARDGAHLVPGMREPRGGFLPAAWQ